MSFTFNIFLFSTFEVLMKLKHLKTYEEKCKHVAKVTVKM